MEDYGTGIVEILRDFPGGLVPLAFFENYIASGTGKEEILKLSLDNQVRRRRSFHRSAHG